MPSEQRHQSDRRRRPRGGRRASDVAGFTPLVFVVESNDRQREVCETILAKLRFAVAPFASADAAVAVMSGLRPEVVASGRSEYAQLRERMSAASDGAAIPLVLIPEDASPEAIVETIREGLRSTPIAS